jgi:hypothetical protein
MERHVYEPTWSEKLLLRQAIDEVELTYELITYYTICSVFGFVTGYGMGSMIGFIQF